MNAGMAIIGGFCLGVGVTVAAFVMKFVFHIGLCG